MSRSSRPENRSVALYWDFENLHASLIEARFGEGSYAKPDNRFKVQEPLVEIQAIVELAASFGPIAINRAYCNWQFFGRYRDALLQGSVELIQLFPPGASAKNGADIKLCLDAVEDIGRFDHLATVIVVGGDSDFMPVAQKIKAAGRTLIGIGSRKSTNRHWAKSCHEFRYYENLLDDRSAQQSAHDPAAAEPAPAPGDAAAEVLARALRLLAQATGGQWVDKAAILPMIKRLDPTFDTKDHGHDDLGALLEALGGIVEVRRADTGDLVRLR